MGTNYYLEKDFCHECGRYDELHIGKSSGGWAFSLHVIPRKPWTEDWEIVIESLDDWRVLFNDENNRIRNEYGEYLTPAQMLAVITKREGRDKLTDRDFEEGKPYRKLFDYRNLADFLAKNHAWQDSKGLLRHTEAYGNDITSTYDLIEGEFS